MQVHLFDIDIPGGVTFKESDTLSAGKTGTVVDTDAGRLGIAICYDIRFPELAMMYAQRGAQLIVYPGEGIIIPTSLESSASCCGYRSCPFLGLLSDPISLTMAGIPLHVQALYPNSSVYGQFFMEPFESSALNTSAPRGTLGHDKGVCRALSCASQVS